MRKEFPGYFTPTEEQYKNIWNDATFVLDANVLLNLYRYSSETQDEVIKILELTKDRLWIPYQVADEFLRNRLSVISQHSKSYNEAIKQLDLLINDFENNKQHPFISDINLKKLSDIFDDIKKELTEGRDNEIKKSTEDKLLDQIVSFCEGKIGANFSLEEKKKISQEGKTRYDLHIPPGYKDKEKIKGDPSGLKQYGDFFIWKQILKQASASKKNIILVTDDQKEDWWTIFQGMPLHPRPELIKEFADETGKSILIYQSNRFIKYAATHFKKDINEGALKEMEDLKELNKPESAITKIQQYVESVNLINSSINSLRHELSALSKEQNDVGYKIKILSTQDMNDENIRSQINQYENQLILIGKGIDDVSERIGTLTEFINEQRRSTEDTFELLKGEFNSSIHG